MCYSSVLCVPAESGIVSCLRRIGNSRPSTVQRPEMLLRGWRREVFRAARASPSASAMAPGVSWRRQAGTDAQVSDTAAAAAKRQRTYTPNFREKFGVPLHLLSQKALWFNWASQYSRSSLSPSACSTRQRVPGQRGGQVGFAWIAANAPGWDNSRPALRRGGEGRESSHAVMVDTSEVERMIRVHGWSLENTVMRMMLDGEEVLVVPRQLQRHPVSEAPVSCNWLRLKEAAFQSPTGAV